MINLSRLVPVLFFFALLLVVFDVHAAPPPCAPYVPLTAQKLAANTTWQVEQAQYGWHFYWWCEDKVGTARSYGYTCSYEGGECNTLKAVTWIKQMLAMPDAQRAAAVSAAWTANIKYDCDDPASAALTDYVGKICTEHNWLYVNRKAAWLADYKAPVWQVKAINDQPTRPAYALVNGVLGTTIKARATIGAVCDMGRPYLLAGSYAYAAYDATGYVALCWRTQ